MGAMGLVQECFVGIDIYYFYSILDLSQISQKTTFFSKMQFFNLKKSKAPKNGVIKLDEIYGSFSISIGVGNDVLL